MASRIRLAALAAAASIGCAHAPPSAPAATKVDFTPIPEMEAVHATNPHDYRGKPLCQRCHLQGERGLTRDPVALCSQCHDAKRMKHPYGVPQPNPPADLKFGADGAIVCHTCHDPHDVKAHQAGLRDEYTPLCMRCHVRHSTASQRK